jgi:hypothetical protein
LDPAASNLHGELIPRYWKKQTILHLDVHGEQIIPLDDDTTFLPRSESTSNSVDDPDRLDPHILHGEVTLTSDDNWDPLILHGESLSAPELDPFVAHVFDWSPSFHLDGEIQFLDEEEIIFEDSVPVDHGIVSCPSAHTDTDPPLIYSSIVTADEKYDMAHALLDLLDAQDGVYSTPPRDHKDPLPPAEPPPEDPPPPAEPPPSPIIGGSNTNFLVDVELNCIKHHCSITTGIVEMVMLTIMDFTKSWPPVNKNISQCLLVIQLIAEVMLHGEILLLLIPRCTLTPPDDEWGAEPALAYTTCVSQAELPCLTNVLKMQGSTLLELVCYLNGDDEDGLLKNYEERKQRQDVHIKFKRGTCFCMREKIDREETGPSCGLGSISFPVRKREQDMYPHMYGSTIGISYYVELPGFGVYVERSTF